MLNKVISEIILTRWLLSLKMIYVIRYINKLCSTFCGDCCMQLLYKTELMFTSVYDASHFGTTTPPDQLEHLQSNNKDRYSGKSLKQYSRVGSHYSWRCPAMCYWRRSACPLEMTRGAKIACFQPLLSVKLACVCLCGGCMSVRGGGGACLWANIVVWHLFLSITMYCVWF